MKDLSIILLAGGLGSRMNSKVPKQFLPLKGKPLACYSYEILKDYGEIIVVAPSSYHSIFPESSQFAEPGKRRQDSVYNGLLQTKNHWVLIHDAARPFITRKMVEEVYKEAKECGAAALACPIKFTVKESDEDGFVQRTLERSRLWEIQTPQVIRRDILEKGFEIAETQNITVTDDTSLAELAGYPVKLCPGSYRNIKITTPDDLLIAQNLCIIN